MKEPQCACLFRKGVQVRVHVGMRVCVCSLTMFPSLLLGVVLHNCFNQSVYN